MEKIEGLPVGQTFRVRDIGVVTCIAVSQNGETLYVKFLGLGSKPFAIHKSQIIAYDKLQRSWQQDPVAAWNMA